MAVKTFTSGEVLTAADTNTYLANAGLVVVKSQTIGTGVSTVNVTSAFSATYDNYRIVVSGGVSGGATAISVTLGATATGYYITGMFNQFGTTAVTALNVSNGAAWTNVGRASTTNISANFELYQPFTAKNTGINVLSTDYNTAGYFVAQGGYLANTTSYTDFTLTNVSSTFTGGIVTVYGYRLG